MTIWINFHTGLSNGADRVPQQKAVLKFEHDFEDYPQDFLRWTDLLNSHLQQTGLQRSTIVQGDVPADGGPRPEYNIFEHFGMITEDMVIADRDRLLVEFDFKISRSCKHYSWESNWTPLIDCKKTRKGVD